MQHCFEAEDLRTIHDKCSLSSQKCKPLVTLAYAQSLDGSISQHGKERLILSSQESFVMTHKLRSHHDALLVGVGTVILDDPLLTVRHVKGKNPQVVILDSKLRIPITSKLLKNPILPIIFTTQNADSEKQKILMEMNVKVVVLDSARDGRIDLNSVLEKLSHFGIKSVMVEGGREIITSFVNENLANKVSITVAPIFVGGLSVFSKKMNEVCDFPKLKNITQYKLGKDLIITGDIERNLA